MTTPSASKQGLPPPLVGLFCVCAVFIVVHSFAGTSPAPPPPLTPVAASSSGDAAVPSQKVSLLAISRGAVLNGQSKAEEKKQVGYLGSLVTKEEKLEQKERNHIKDEEKNLKEEEKLLKKEEAAFQKGDTKKVESLKQHLDGIQKAQTRHASIAGKAILEEHGKEAQLTQLFQEWAAERHPELEAKFARKHQKDVKRQHKAEKDLSKLEERQTRVLQKQASFVAKRSAFENEVSAKASSKETL